MENLNEFSNNREKREYDALEQVLAERPALKAPRDTRSRVMARLAALPQVETPVIVKSEDLTPKYAAPVVKYEPPAVLPLPPVPFEPDSFEPVEGRQRRLLFAAIAGGAGLGMTLLLLWALWPAISNLVFGPSTDPGMQAHLAVLQGLWGSVSRFFGDFLNAYGPLLPTLVSLAVGLALMTTTVVGGNIYRRNLRPE